MWEDLEGRLSEESTVSVVQVVFYAIATVLAGIAVLLDSAILVVGAMIVGPEYGALAGVSAGLVQGRWPLVRRALWSLTVGFLVGIAVTIVATWGLAAAGLVDETLLLRERPQTGFIYAPDALSFVVAFLAGLAGMVALTAGRSGAVLGVLVSVTTIPAAGNCAVAVAFSATTDSADSRRAYLDQAATSLGQLLLNASGIVLAGLLVLFLHRLAWTRVGSAGA